MYHGEVVFPLLFDKLWVDVPKLGTKNGKQS